MKNRRTERKIEALVRELHIMARKKASGYVDDVVLDAAAEKIVGAFGTMLIKERAFDFFVLYGKPTDLKERKAASEYILGKKYHKYLADNSESIKERFTKYLEQINVRLSSMTKGEKNENK